MGPSEVVAAFIEAINAHDARRIAALCTADHRFVDAHGVVVAGEGLPAAWAGYFGFMPHYGIDVVELLEHGGTVAVFGQAWGGLDAADPSVRAWRRPCAWRARVEGERVKLWQVYVDTKVVFDLL